MTSAAAFEAARREVDSLEYLAAQTLHRCAYPVPRRNEIYCSGTLQLVHWRLHLE